MTTTLEQLLEGKAYQRGNSLYPTTEDIVSPFIKQVENYVDKYEITAIKPRDLAVDVQIKEGDVEEVQEHSVFTRVLVEGVLKPEYQLVLGENDIYSKTISMLYALDVQNPIIKVYSGYLRHVCLNMCVFNPSSIVTKHFTDADFDNIYNNVPVFINRIEEEKTQYTEALEFMYNTQYTVNDLPNVLGTLAKQCIAKNNGLNTAYSNLVKMLYSSQDVNGVRNIYYNPEGIYTPYDLYQGLTATISHKTDITKRPDLTLKVYKMFSDN